MLNKETSLDDVVKQVRALSDSCKPIWPFKNEINLRVPAVKLDLYLQHLFDIRPPSTCPKLSITAEKLAANLSMGGVPNQDRNQEEKLALEAQIGSFELSTYHESKTNTLQ